MTKSSGAFQFFHTLLTRELPRQGRMFAIPSRIAIPGRRVRKRRKSAGNAILSIDETSYAEVSIREIAGNNSLALPLQVLPRQVPAPPQASVSARQPAHDTTDGRPLRLFRILRQLRTPKGQFDCVQYVHAIDLRCSTHARRRPTLWNMYNRRRIRRRAGGVVFRRAGFILRRNAPLR